ncbi:hypothetical protein IE4803_CH01838 [Rhizobium etli bv. phaseoli str. IE4803]|nr:hypothetical protein IE4803_CH01838 [Rhizobium etli bv. phaseoli str. IE4803]
MIVRKSQEGILEKRHSAAAEKTIFPSRDTPRPRLKLLLGDHALFRTNHSI